MKFSGQFGGGTWTWWPVAFFAFDLAEVVCFDVALALLLPGVFFCPVSLPVKTFKQSWMG